MAIDFTHKDEKVACSVINKLIGGVDSVDGHSDNYRAVFNSSNHYFYVKAGNYTFEFQMSAGNTVTLIANYNRVFKCKNGREFILKKNGEYGYCMYNNSTNLFAGFVMYNKDLGDKDCAHIVFYTLQKCTEGSVLDKKEVAKCIKAFMSEIHELKPVDNDKVLNSFVKYVKKSFDRRFKKLGALPIEFRNHRQIGDDELSGYIESCLLINNI